MCTILTKLGAILVLGLFLCGCGWLSGGRGEEMIEPDREFSVPPAQRTETKPNLGPQRPPEPAVADPAPGGPVPAATQPATGPYRVAGPPEVVEAAVLQVNSSFITVQQALHPIRRKLQTLANASAGDAAAFRRAALILIAQEANNQIERTLLLAEAEKRLAEQDRKAIDEEVNKIYRRAVAESGGSKTAFLRLLSREGTDLKTWHNDLWSMFAIRTYTHQQLDAKVHITREMMWKHYQAHAGKYRTEDRVQMQIIAAPFEAFLPEGSAGTQAEREEAVKQAQAHVRKGTAALVAGTEFSEVARTYSRGPMASAGGGWPMMARGSFRAEAVEEAAFTQRDGQVSQVITTKEGLYVVKTLARRPGEQMPFEKVQDEIKGELRAQQLSRLRREHLSKLRSEATIVGADRFSEVAVNAAARKYLRP